MVRRVANSTYVGSLDGGDSTRVVDGIHATYAAGHLIYVKEGALFSQPFDPDRRRVTGAPVSLATGVSEDRAVSATERNVVAFVENVTAGKLVWFNRASERLDEIASSAPLANPVLMSPTQVIGAISVRGVQGVWIGDLDRRVFTRLTSRGIAPVSSPDNRKVVFTSEHAGGIRDLYVLDLQRGPEQLLLTSRENKMPTDWTRDGRYIVYGSTNEITKQDLWMLPMEGDREPVPIVSSPFNEIQARVSSDGRWFAYASDETGRWEVYLQSFPVAGNKQVVSVGGGGQPHWRADGKELFYLALDRTLMSVSLTGSSVPQIGRPKPLFQMPVADVVGWNNWFTPDPDGRKFVVSSVETTERPEIVVIFDALR